MPEEVRADLLLGRDTLSPGLVKAGQAASDASSNIRQLTRDIYEVSKQRATPVVDLDDADATAKLADVSAKLRDLGAKAANPGIDVQDKKAQAKLADMRVKLDTLGKKVASPRITLEGLDRAEAGILRLDVQLDELSRKHATPSVSGGALSKLLGLFGGSGGPSLFSRDLGGLAGAGGGGGAGLGALLPSGGILAAIAGALALAPAAVPVGLGALIGGAGVYGADKIDPSLFKGIEKNLKSSALTALTSGGGLTGTPAGIFAPLSGQSSFLSGIMSILKQLSGFVKTFGPQLADLFRASLPFVSAFVKVMEQFAKAVLPAVTQSLKLMAPDLPIIIQGFRLLSQGVAGFITNLGPGMRASAIIFKAAMEVVKGLLQLTGKLASWFAEGIVKTAETIRKVAADIPPFFDKMRHDVAAIFDATRHDIAQIWDGIYQDTIGQVVKLVKDINTWFSKLPSDIRNILTGLGKTLLGIGSMSMQDFLHGLESVAGSIFSWAKNFITSLPGKFLSWLGMSPPHPGSAFYDVGVSIMHHLASGLRSRAGSVQGALGGAVSGAAGSAQAFARRLAGAYGWSSQWADINAIAMRESGWSLTARNPSSGAYGIAQFINGPSEYYQYGGNPNTVAGQVTAFFNYIRQRYGSPAAGWAHEQNYGWYGSGLSGGIFSSPTLIGVGERGPERVDITPIASPNRGGAGMIVLHIEGSDQNLVGALVQAMRKHVRVAGGGDVQVALGKR